MILAIETALDRVGVALGDSSGVLAATVLASDRRHAESLAPAVAFVLEQAGLTPGDLDHVAVDVGPGLFTGMRVGIATAKAMAWALDLPCVGVSSLEAVAHATAETTMTVAVALDARRGEVYWALYRLGPNGEPHLLGEMSVDAPEDAAVAIAERDEPVLTVGSGFIRFAQEFAVLDSATAAPSSLAAPDARDVLALAVHRAARDETVTAGGLEPLYLRAPDAEINWSVREAAR